MIPKAILLDLDDTIIAYDEGIDTDGCWRTACGPHLDGDEVRISELIERIKKQARWYWSDPERHRAGRMDLDIARTAIVDAALRSAGYDFAAGVAEQIAVTHGQERDRALALYEGSVETLNHLGDAGVKLALITNGSSRAQRAKIERFALARHFDCILIEGEFGSGKPELAVYEHAMRQLNVEASDTWMVGDNFEWEIVAPQKLNIKGIWINPKGLVPPADVTPFRTLARLSELPGVLASLAR